MLGYAHQSLVYPLNKQHFKLYRMIRWSRHDFYWMKKIGSSLQKISCNHPSAISLSKLASLALFHTVRQIDQLVLDICLNVAKIWECKNYGSLALMFQIMQCLNSATLWLVHPEPLDESTCQGGVSLSWKEWNWRTSVKFFNSAFRSTWLRLNNSG